MKLPWLGSRGIVWWNAWCGRWIPESMGSRRWNNSRCQTAVQVRCRKIQQSRSRSHSDRGNRSPENLQKPCRGRGAPPPCGMGWSWCHVSVSWQQGGPADSQRASTLVPSLPSTCPRASRPSPGARLENHRWPMSVELQTVKSGNYFRN